MKMILAILALCLLLAPGALAHEPRPGPNGGLMVDAGSYHAELLADGTSKVTLFLFDINDKPIESAGFKANAILIINGKPLRFTLEPAGGQILSGEAPARVEPGVKGAVQISLPDGGTVQAKY